MNDLLVLQRYLTDEDIHELALHPH
jgi:hypothetical protein